MKSNQEKVTFIDEIDIKNFKSITKMNIELGRVNLIIGANGVGKTNILEAIAMGAAANADKLDYEFLSNRIRLTSPEFMRNAFQKNSEDIKITFKTKDKIILQQLYNNKEKWNKKNIKKEIKKEIDPKIKNWLKILKTGVELDRNFFQKNIEEIEQLSTNHKMTLDKKEINKIFISLEERLKKLEEIEKKINSDKENHIQNFLIYSPEYSYLREFQRLGQIIPLGLRGEGLFYKLKQILKAKDKTQLDTIKKYLKMLDWFEDFNVPKDLISTESRISIKDRFIDDDIDFFDQRSANEGFLLLLFYLILFTSEDTPPFFAVDNIETGFNPKLCRTLMTTFSKLSKEYDKQVIFTTHNPAILDGIDLKDDQQRLFVVTRGRDGKSKIKRVKHKSKSTKKLSELWMNGVIGGLPNNF